MTAIAQKLPHAISQKAVTPMALEAAWFIRMLLVVRAPAVVALHETRFVVTAGNKNTWLKRRLLSITIKLPRLINPMGIATPRAPEPVANRAVICRVYLNLHHAPSVLFHDSTLA